MVNSSFIIQAFCPGSRKTSSASGKKFITDTILPFVILPILLVIASVSLSVTITVMVEIAIGVLYVQSRPRQKNRSPFFHSWTLASCTTMFLVFEIGIMEMRTITQLEHFVLLVLIGCTCYFFSKMKAVAEFELATGRIKRNIYNPVKSDSLYCKVCEIEVNDRFFHSIWWDCCVRRSNYPYFICGQAFAFVTLLHGSNLALTTVCRPFVIYGDFLLPRDCELVYDRLRLALVFVTCVYGLGYVSVIALILLYHLFKYIPKYSEPQLSKLFHIRPTST